MLNADAQWPVCSGPDAITRVVVIEYNKQNR